MDVREKLVELIAQKVCGTWSEGCDEWMPHDCGKCYANDCHISEIADHLLSNGVTVQEWISVKDRLPNKPMRCLVYTKRGEYLGYEITYYNQGFHTQYAETIYWMPLPQPPKGE